MLGIDDFDSVLSKDANDGKGCIQKHERVSDQQSLLVEPQDGREDARGRVGGPENEEGRDEWEQVGAV